MPFLGDRERDLLEAISHLAYGNPFLAERIEWEKRALGAAFTPFFDVWHPRADVSTIVPLVDEPVTSFQHGAVVTEQGIAWMWGRDERQQARNLIEHAAHPSVRDDLWEEAVALGLA